MLSGYVLLQEPKLLDRRGAVGRGSRLRTHTDSLGFEFVIHASVAQSTDTDPLRTHARDGTRRPSERGLSSSVRRAIGQLSDCIPLAAGCTAVHLHRGAVDQDLR
jgi:hypothetical protein